MGKFTKSSSSLLLLLLTLSSVQLISADPGDTFSEAITLTSLSRDGNVQDEGSVFYRFQFQADTEYSIVLDVAPEIRSSTDFDLILHSADNTIVQISDSVSYPEILEFTTESTIDFIIQVVAARGSGAFSLEINLGFVESDDSLLNAPSYILVLIMLSIPVLLRRGSSN